MRKVKVNEKGFTLVELLVVIAIIALLMGLLIPGLGIVRRNARDTGRRTDLEATKLLIEEYYVKYNKYPASADIEMQGASTVELDGQEVMLDFEGTTVIALSAGTCNNYDDDHTDGLAPENAQMCYVQSGTQSYELLTVMEAGGVFELSPSN